MNITTISMNREDAQAAFLDYRAAVHARHNAEDAELVKMYGQLAEGRQLLSIRQVMRETGLDEKGNPRIAIVRADGRHCYFHPHSGRTGGMFSIHESDKKSNQQETVIVSDVWQRSNHSFAWKPVRAVAPIIPPRLRPIDELSRYWILFEPVWENVPHPDPILLRRINKDVFAVLAVWDLTPIELMVLEKRNI